MRIDRERGQIYFKLTYFGPGFAGKQTSLRYIWNKTRPEDKTAFQNVLPSDELGPFSLEELEKREQSLHGRQVWFELTPATLAPIIGLRVKLDLQANSGALWSPATRRLSLEGADGVMFVADSSVEKNDANLDAMRMLEQFLTEGVACKAQLPRVLCYNKRNMDGVRDLVDLERDLNPRRRWPSFATAATTGDGVFAALKALVSEVIRPCREDPGRPAAE